MMWYDSHIRTTDDERHGMLITITVPEGYAIEYVEEVAAQMRAGCTEGHHDAVTHWTTEGR
jgi:hypothetical protein